MPLPATAIWSECWMWPHFLFAIVSRQLVSFNQPSNQPTHGQTFNAIAIHRLFCRPLPLRKRQCYYRHFSRGTLFVHLLLLRGMLFHSGWHISVSSHHVHVNGSHYSSRQASTSSRLLHLIAVMSLGVTRGWRWRKPQQGQLWLQLEPSTSSSPSASRTIMGHRMTNKPTFPFLPRQPLDNWRILNSVIVFICSTVPSSTTCPNNSCGNRNPIPEYRTNRFIKGCFDINSHTFFIHNNTIDFPLSVQSPVVSPLDVVFAPFPRWVPVPGNFDWLSFNWIGKGIFPPPPTLNWLQERDEWRLFAEPVGP